MDIVLITAITPASENIRGTSALPYHLLIHRPNDVRVTIYSYNFNQLTQQQIEDVEAQLNVDIILLDTPKWFSLVLKCHLLLLRILLRLPFLSYVKLPIDLENKIIASRPDCIWVYGEEISGILDQFSSFKRMNLGPDSEALYYYRMLGSRFVFSNTISYWRNIIMYPKYLRLENNYIVDKNVTYYVVGEDDAKFVRNINPQVNVKFLRHPHYHVDSEQKPIHFHSPIRLLIAGQNNLYMNQDTIAFVNALSQDTLSSAMKEKFEITFLGKGWESCVAQLESHHWKVKQITFAPDYIEEIKKHDIQITPISVGTGTKGKVLDALSNGLLVIGSHYALENVAVSSGISCIEYEKPSDIVTVLKEVVDNPNKYEEFAIKGRHQVLSEHSRTFISKSLFESIG